VTTARTVVYVLLAAWCATGGLVFAFGLIGWALDARHKRARTTNVVYLSTRPPSRRGPTRTPVG
jgi:hypothetical protein